MFREGNGPREWEWERLGRGQQAGRARRVGGGKEMVQADIKKSRRGNKKAETVEIVGVANGRSHVTGEKRHYG